jgi:hypothetical protein
MPTDTFHLTFVIATNSQRLRAACAGVRADAQRLAASEGRVDSIGEEVIDNEAAMRQADAVVAEMLQVVRRRAARNARFSDSDK